MIRTVAVAGVLLVVAAGCGGSSTGGADAGTGGSGGESLSTFCGAVRDGLAARAEACFGGPAEGWRLIVTGEAPNDLCTQLSTGVGANRIRFDPAQTQACLGALASAACAGIVSGAPPPACDAAVAGLVPIGGACASDPECAGEAYCDASTCPGRCAFTVAIGAACTEDGAPCAGGATCSGGRCLLDAGIGQACGLNLPQCQIDLVCLAQGADAQTGTCGARRTSGLCSAAEACAAGYACVGPPESARCIPAKRVGEACTAGQNECAFLTSCVGGRCALFPTLGGTCDPLGDAGEPSDCLQGICSLQGSCVALLKAGAACDFDEECESQSCQAGACAALCAAP